MLGLWAATAMIAAAGEPSLRAKWPNDLVLGDRKVGGILTEAWVDAGRLAHVVVGAGVNLGTGETDLPRQLRSTAATLAADPDVLLVRFLKALRPGADLPAGTLLERYRPLCSTLGRTVRATAVTGEQLEGVAVDLDARGGLVVEADGGRATVAFGEAALLR